LFNELESADPRADKFGAHVVDKKGNSQDIYGVVEPHSDGDKNVRVRLYDADGKELASFKTDIEAYDS
jgi:hypothetical protein